jgi:hypothetical protein
MQGDEDRPSLTGSTGTQGDECRRCLLPILREREVQGVHYRISGNDDRVGLNPFIQESTPIPGGRRQVKPCQPRYLLPIDLLRERILPVTRSQTRFDMGYWCALKYARQSRGKRGRRVSLYHNKIGPERDQHRPEPLENTGGSRSNSLPRLHDVEIEIRNDLEEL